MNIMTAAFRLMTYLQASIFMTCVSAMRQASLNSSSIAGRCYCHYATVILIAANIIVWNVIETKHLIKGDRKSGKCQKVISCIVSATFRLISLNLLSIQTLQKCQKILLLYLEHFIRYCTLILGLSLK